MRRTAVTGTNGKTSTVEFVRQLFAHTGYRAASYGTLGLVTEDGRNPDPRVSFGPQAIPAFLSRLEREGVDVVSLEAYSSSLATEVFDRVTVDVAAFTNLARDHLDYHNDMAAYFGAKRSLFVDTLADDGIAVINRDDDRADDLVTCCQERGINIITFGRSSVADVRIREAAPTSGGTRARLSVDGRRINVEFGFVGEVMVSNACCALAIALAAGLPPGRALNSLEELRAPPGRLDRVAVHDGAEVFVDYAHTPAALRAVSKTLQKRVSDDLIVVFGCGGDRDCGKRRRMGEVAAEYADAAIVTDDNPRGEDPRAIREAILDGCPDARECGSRQRAIADALRMATDGDIVVVAGKGHERTQVIGDRTRKFSDHDVIDRLTSGSMSSPKPTTPDTKMSTGSTTVEGEEKGE